jgi:2-hydroxy-3-keto-5-methylthiopentenyl-1-phosphate phosphatase
VTAVFVDYDGTITQRDTFDILVHACAGAHVWTDLERRLSAGSMTLREVLAAQAAFVRLSIDEAEAAIAAETGLDPSFFSFVGACRREGAELTILSGGIGTLIGRALERAGLTGVRYHANDADFSPDGWIMSFRDDSEHGHDKALAVRAAASRGLRTVFVGDGISDFEAAQAAGERFAKRGKALERFLRERGIPHAVFTGFAEVEAALFTKGEAR